MSNLNLESLKNLTPEQRLAAIKAANSNSEILLPTGLVTVHATDATIEAFLDNGFKPITAKDINGTEYLMLQVVVDGTSNTSASLADCKEIVSKRFVSGLAPEQKLAITNKKRVPFLPVFTTCKKDSDMNPLEFTRTDCMAFVRSFAELNGCDADLSTVLSIIYTGASFKVFCFNNAFGGQDFCFNSAQASRLARKADTDSRANKIYSNIRMQNDQLATEKAVARAEYFVSQGNAKKAMEILEEDASRHEEAAKHFFDGKIKDSEKAGDAATAD